MNNNQPKNKAPSNPSLRLASRSYQRKIPFHEKIESWPKWAYLLLIPQEEFITKPFYPRFLLWILMMLFTLQVLGSGAQAGIVHFLHNINLPIHETGHLVFGIFGWDWLSSLGGSLFQIIMPLVCCGALLLQTRDHFGASIAFWWALENFVDLAPYIGDARAGILPLLGGNTGQNAPYGFHDWQFVLGEMGLSHYDLFLSKMAQYLGILGMILALLWGAWILYYAKFLGKHSKESA